MAFAEAGQEVLGVDLDAAKVEALNAGRSYIEDVPDSALAPLGERLRASADYADMAACEAVIVCVPTPLTSSREPDLTYLIEAATAIAGVLRSGQLVVLESTTYPGTTRERLTPILEQSGLAVGSDVFVAFSPERIDPGRTDYTIRTTPKLVGGMTPACTERARELYALVCDEVVVVSTPEAAELSKLLENVFRSVNIAFVNELAQLCDRPFVPELPQFGLASVDLDAGLAAADLAAIVTAHDSIDYAQVVQTAPRTLDFRGVTRDIESETLERL